MKEKTKLEKYLEKGWEIQDESDSYITIRRPKKFNWTMFLVCALLLNIFGLIIYPLYYVFKSPWETKIIKKVKEIILADKTEFEEKIMEVLESSMVGLNELADKTDLTKKEVRKGLVSLVKKGIIGKMDESDELDLDNKTVIGVRSKKKSEEQD